MATVTHGLKDGIDEILEKCNALDNILRMREYEVKDQDKRDRIVLARESVSSLKQAATETRARLEDLRRAAA